MSVESAKIAVSLFRLWVRCASRKWCSLLLYFTFFFFFWGELKRWKTGLMFLSDKMTDCVLCSGTGISSSDICTVCSRGGKKKKQMSCGYSSPFLINDKMLCASRCVHDVPFPRKEWLTLSGFFQQSHWPLTRPPTPANNKHSAETFWYHPYSKDKFTQKMKMQSLSTHPCVDGNVG